MRIGVISTYPDLTRRALRLAAEGAGELVVKEGALDRAVQIAARMEQEDGVDAIVTGPVNALLARRTVSVPVITIPITAYDIMLSLYQAQKLSERVAFIGHRSTTGRLDFEAMGRMLRMTVCPYLYDTQRDLLAQLRQVAADGLPVVVGTGICIVEAARELHLQGVLVQAQDETVHQAVEAARAAVQTRRQDRERERQLLAVLDALSAGIIAVDPAGVVKVFNPAAQALLGFRHTDALGRPARQCAAHHGFAQVYGDGQPATGLVVRLGQAQVLVSRHPMGGTPGDPGLVITLEDVTQIQRLDRELREKLRARGHVAAITFDRIAGRSPAIRQAVAQAQLFARSEGNILITGESGTGKELFAQAIHNASSRARGPFVAVNCAALPENLLESELFGYEEGSFTGARKGGRPGLFEQAHRGTIFLDEIGEIAPSVQARLLRVLQQREVMRIGGERVIPVDVRIIAATNRDLRQLVGSGQFRADLYYRLNVLRLRVPPLRQRPEDIPDLVQALLAEHARGTVQAAELFPPPALEQLKAYHWPGNVRELENLVQKVLALHAAGRPDPEGPGGPEGGHLRQLLADLWAEGGAPPAAAVPADAPAAAAAPPAPPASPLAVTVPLGSLDQMEREIILQAARLLGPNRSLLAGFLGISRTTLWRRLREAGLDPDREPESVSS